jgi:zinc transport system permease protein
MNNLLEMFSYDFMLRALIGGVLMTVSAALVGIPLVLRRQAMLGDGLSHVGFAAFALAAVFGLMPTEFAIPVVMLVSFLLLKLNNSSKISGDAVIALVSAGALAIGVLLISVNGINIDINSYLFGSILATSQVDIIISIVLALAVIIMYILCHNQIFAMTFDEKFAKSIGLKTNFYSVLFALLCSAVVVLGMKLVGALMISSLIIFPAIIACQVAKSFKNVVFFGVTIALLNFLVGLVLSYVFSLPTGATVVVINLVSLVFFKLISLFK